MRNDADRLIEVLHAKQTVNAGRRYDDSVREPEGGAEEDDDGPVIGGKAIRDEMLDSIRD